MLVYTPWNFFDIRLHHSYNYIVCIYYGQVCAPIIATYVTHRLSYVPSKLHIVTCFCRLAHGHIIRKLLALSC